MNFINILCTPAKIYLMIVSIGFIVMLFNQITLTKLIVPIITIPLWTMLLNWLCSKGLTTLSWVFVTIQIIFICLLMRMYMSKIYSK